MRIHLAIALGLPVERAPDLAHNDASPNYSADNTHGGAVGMIVSIPRNERELGFYIAEVPRTGPAADHGTVAIGDRTVGMEETRFPEISRDFSHALRGQEVAKLVSISFPNDCVPSVCSPRMALPISHLSCRPSLPRHTVGVGA